MILINREVVLFLVISVCHAVTNGTTSAATTAAPEEASLQGESTTTEAPSVDCGSPNDTIIENGSWNNTSGVTTINSTATLQCNLGYEPNSSETTITCQINGNWSNVTTRCELGDCGSPDDSIIENGSWNITSGVTTFNSTSTLQCNHGYEHNSSQTTITCQHNGNWSSVTTTCVLKDCRTPPNITNGSWQATGSTDYGSNANLECQSGYEPSDATKTITCQANGTWSSVATMCQPIDCRTPPNITNGSWQTTGSTEYGSNAYLECKSGYEPSDATKTTITCQANGTWSSVVTMCQPKDCGFPSNTSVVNGTWTINGSTKVNSTATLGCYPGYYASNTNQTVITCQNDGSWSNLTVTCELMDLAYNHTCYPKNPSKCFTENAVCITSSIEEGWRCLCKSELLTYNKLTDKCAPAIPENVTLEVYDEDIHNTSITLTLGTCPDDTHNYSAHISPGGESSRQMFNCSAADFSKTTFGGLSPGTNYTFVLSLYVEGMASHTNTTITQYTRPHTIDFINFSSILETTMTISWGFFNTSVGTIDSFRLFVSSNSSTILVLDNSTTNYEYILQDLNGGTVYNVNVYSLIGNLSNETPQTATECTHPTRPHNGTVISQEVNAIQISYAPTADEIELYNIFYDDNNFTSIIQNEARVLIISMLEQGTNYTFNVTSLTCNKQSLTPEIIDTFTRPGKPTNVTISGQLQTSLNVTWSAPSIGGWSSFNIWLTTQNSTIVKPNAGVETNFHQFTDLKAGTIYTVHVQTTWRGLISAETTKVANTAPTNFTVRTTNLTETTITFVVDPPIENLTFTFNLTDTKPPELSLISLTDKGNEVKFTDLIPGRQYKLDVIATLGEVNSTDPTTVMVNTRPGLVENITLVEEKTTNTTMAIRWDNPFGDFDNITFIFNCTGPNRGLLNCSDTLDNSPIETSCSLLDPGTFCTVELQTKSGYQAGHKAFKNITKSTKEEAPSPVTVSTTADSSRAITITWLRPSTPNGIIRKYRVVVKDTTGACNNTNIIKEIECSGCLANTASVDESCTSATIGNDVSATPNLNFTQEFTETMNASFLNLVPGRNYTVTVIPYTKCWGQISVVNVWTNEEVPKGPPMDLRSSESTDMLIFNWSRPRCEDITGVITFYTVEVNYTNITCYPNGEPIVDKFNTNSLTFVLENIQPYNNYTYRISAWTAIGHGPSTSPETLRTQAKAPDPVMKLNYSTITDTSADLAWKAPCFPNGIMSNYSISIINKDTNTTVKVTSTETNTTQLQDLLPFRNYTIRVAPLNHENLTGNNTDLDITTRQGVPHRIQNLTSHSITGSSFTVRWSPPDLYTGVTNYTVKSVDVYFNRNLPDQTIWGFNSTELTVNNLKAYWNYTIKVKTATIAGPNESSSLNVRTSETKPGPIANLTLHPEVDVTKPRTVTVVWQEPKLEDKNGIITGYAIRYGYNNTRMLQVNRSAPINSVVLTSVSTGYINIEVAAMTSVGEGNVTYSSTDVQPGAPLKLNESSGQLLMQPSSQEVPDSERQISIMLPLRSFFCNYTNGKTTRWGLVVAETSITYGNKPYNGDVAGFYITLKSYRKWNDIKKADVIDPYIPTSSDWNPCKTDSKLRNRRSVPEVVDMPFVIGADKECDAPDPNGFCNGQLAPGRSYSVRGYVCTDGGCTESQYSPPIRTDPDPTIPIVVGVLSAAVVILVGVVVIVFMKRRQTACFAKKVERPNDLKETEATEMTEKGTKVHTFKPSSVLVSEFPGHVTDMHKDSNLLFADAFVMVKEKSPALSSSMSESQACRPKNRYTNILSFDHSRVKILPLEDVDGSDFINANYIPGHKSKRAYIATQGPLPATFDDFWRMIWEQNVGVIVMLTKLVEKGRNKCDMYWPTLGEPVFYGDIVACTKSESTLSDYTLRVIELKLKDNVRMVRQFCFLKWPDMGCPDHPYLLLDFVKAVRNEYNDEVEKRGPMVVHCSAGVGRTGTFIAVDNLLQYVKEKDTVDIYNLVLEMRHNRCHMVQTEDQFIYIYECLKEFLTVKKEEEVVVEEEPVYENTGDAVYENMGFSSS